MRFVRLVAIITGVSIALSVSVGPGVSPAPTPGSSPFQQVLRTGESFQDPRLSLTFVVPATTIAHVRARGNFFEVELSPAQGEAFYVYSTTFRIRRPAGLENPGVIFGPCAPPKIPEGDRFDVSAVCEGVIGLNRIRRTVRIIREEQLLFFFHLTYRVEDAEPADRILRSVRLNPDFRDVSARFDSNSEVEP